MAKRKKHRKPTTPPIPVGREPVAPTPERMRRGSPREIRTGPGFGAERVFYDPEAGPIERAYARGLLTEAQRNAGQEVERLARLASGSPSGRSCLDFSPRGSGGEGVAMAKARIKLYPALKDASESVADQEIREGRPEAARALIAAEVRAVVLAVCWEGEGLRDWREEYQRSRYLRRGLAALAEHWGMH